MSGRVVVLTGGVGGAKLAQGLAAILPPRDLTAVVNTGDDFRHFGLAISPDIDTLLYTLSGRSDTLRGWGRAGETWNFMDAARSLSAPDWFALGDGDLALHVLRTDRLACGEPLSSIIADFAGSWGIATKILPMSDDPVATRLETDAGVLDFQDYFVARRCEPRVQTIRFDGAAAARPAPGVIKAIGDARTSAIVIAPSNPYLSIDPILAVPGVAEALRAAKAPVVAVSPIVGGAAVKGPTAKLMAEMGMVVSPAAVAAHYGNLVDAWLVDGRDAGSDFTAPHALADTLMPTLDDKVRVAKAALALAGSLA